MVTRTAVLLLLLALTTGLVGTVADWPGLIFAAFILWAAAMLKGVADVRR